MDDQHPPNNTKNIILWLIGIVLLSILTYGLYWFSQAPEQQLPKLAQNNEPPQLTVEQQPDGTNKVIAEGQPARTFTTGLEDLPRSLEGTDVDGEIIIDENKQLVVTNGLRRLFDYFLTTQGEEDLATIIARIEAYVTHRVPEPARTQVITLFHQYLAYLQATSTITEAGGKPASQIDIDAVIEQKRQLAELRKQYFNDETIEAFWGNEDRYDAYSIELLKINKNNALSAEEKAEARDKLVNKLPDGTMKTQIQEQKKFRTLIDETRRLKATGASPAQIRQLREELYGMEAADRLEVLDEKRAAWQKRVQSYLDQRSVILASDQTEQAKQVQITELRYRMFTEQEQKRLTAYEELGTADLDSAIK